MKKENGLLHKIRTFSYGYIMVFLFDLAVALAFFCLAGDSLSYLAIAVGVIVLLCAAVFAVITLSGERRGAGFFFKMLFAVAALLAGVATLIGRESAIDAIVAALGLLLVVDASFKLQSTALAKRYRSSLWWVLFVLSLLLIAGGFSLIRFRMADRGWLAYLLGVLLVLDGAANLLTPFYLAKWKTVSTADASSDDPARVSSGKDDISAEPLTSGAENVTDLPETPEENGKGDEE